MNKVNKLANNVGRRLILPWNLGTRKGSRGPKTLFKYIAFYWAAWWASIASIFGFIVYTISKKRKDILAKNFLPRQGIAK